MNISIRSTLVLATLGIIALGALWFVETSKHYQKEAYHEEKLAAARLTKKCMTHIKEHFFGDEIQVDNINDPNGTGLIGLQFSEITSGRGSLPIKLSTANPNFAAMIVEQIQKAGLKRGDAVAMCYTGSFPALDIAVSSAVETLGLEPVLITSVTSSSWGANSPDLTYLDMHRSLYEEGLLSFMPVASSIGGNQDIGGTLSQSGREVAIRAIARNKVPYLNEGSLRANVDRRMELFWESGKEIKLFINIGGGVASLGSNTNANRIPPGFKMATLLKDIPDPEGVFYEMVRKDIPTINLHNVGVLMSRYGLPRDPVPLPEIGSGPLYEAYRYDLTIVFLATATLMALIGLVMWIDKKQNRLGTQIIKSHEK